MNEAIAKHEASISQVHNDYEQVQATLQTVLRELQALRVSSAHTPQPSPEVSPVYQEEATSSGNDYHRSQLKLSFPRLDGQDPQGWLYKAEQYFEYKSIPLEQQVPLASFHLEGMALQWHRWFSKYRGPLSWP